MIEVIFALIAVLSLFGIVVLSTKYIRNRLSHNKHTSSLAISIDSLTHIDGKSKVAKISYDNCSYLLLIGNNTSCLIDKFTHHDVQ